MMAETCSTRFITAGARSSIEATAVPMNTEKTTMGRISLLAMALMIESGTRWVVRNSFKVSLAAGATLRSARAEGSRAIPEPGWIRCTITRPTVSETIEARRNQAIALTPTRPTAAASSMCAMPATRVAKTRGAMIILIIRRKMVVITDRPSAKAAAWSGVMKVCAAQPARTPAIIEAMTKMLNRRMGSPAIGFPPSCGQERRRRPSRRGRPLGIRTPPRYHAA